MENDIHNSLTLNQVGVRLLPDEHLEVAVELERGLTEELEQSRPTLLLTNKRLMRYSAGGHRTQVFSVGLEDVGSIEVNRSEKNSQWIWVGLVFITGGIVLGLVTLFVMSMAVSPLLMAISLTLIGIVFVLTFIGGMMGEVIIRAGLKDIKCKMRPKALDDMAVFVQRYYELKLGYVAHSFGLGGLTQASEEVESRTGG